MRLYKLVAKRGRIRIGSNVGSKTYAARNNILLSLIRWGKELCLDGESVMYEF